MENEIIIYQTQDGQTKIDVRIENETVKQSGLRKIKWQNCFKLQNRI